MMDCDRRKIGLSWVVVVALAASGEAAEIVLLPEAHPKTIVVQLRDVARISAASNQQVEALERIELFPSPAAGTKKYLRVRELQDLLLLHGVNLLEHSFAGSSQVAVSVIEEKAPSTPRAERGPTTAELQKAKRLLHATLLKHLEQAGPANEPWEAELDIEDTQLEQIAAFGSTLVVRGGVAPWFGTHLFTASPPAERSHAEHKEVAFRAKISLPPAIVVAARQLPRGAMVQPGDVQLVRADNSATNRDTLGDLQAVVGQQTTQAIPAGRPIDRTAVRPPIVVKQGEAVTVFARSSGVTVRTTARARDTGSVGDLITVETILDRKAFFARVSGIQEVEVYAQSASVAPNEPAKTEP